MTARPALGVGTLVTLVVLLAFPASAFAQFDNAQVPGVVQDTTGVDE